MQTDISTISSIGHEVSSESFDPLDSIFPKNSVQLSCEWNNTYTPYSSSLCIHQLFENQVDRSPNAVAVTYQNRQLSYQELNVRANQLAHILRKKGVMPDRLVGICIERSLEMVIGILGILKAGAAYVPLDPDYPNVRLGYMKEDADLQIILSQLHLKEKVNFDDAEILFLDDNNIKNELRIEPSTNISSENISLNSNNLAYVIYTSGSTGSPKGVMIEHHSLVNRIEWMWSRYGCNASDVVMQKTPFGFDVSVWEFFLPLISGASIVMAKPDGHKDPIYLTKLIRQTSITKLHFVPSMLNALLSSTNLAECDFLRQVFCSGEALQPNYVGSFYQQGIRAELHNLYGPTEASIDVSYWACTESDSKLGSIPIGRPINNTQFYIVDNLMQLVPAGEVGELLIGGVGLARGYLNRAELTAEKFISNPFSNDPKSRLYKTGDLCRFLPDGNVEFLGRLDHQVKIRGYRIELGEIENALLKHDLVTDAVVLSKNMATGSNCLVAYVVSNDSSIIKELREDLEHCLPSYMIPLDFVLLSNLPLTTNGKVDRKALLEMQLLNSTPQSPQDMSFLQSEVYKIWKEILGFDNIVVDDDLFTIGGDSIAAIQIFTAINEEFGVNIYMEEIFSSDHFTIRWLASLIEKYQIELLGQEEYRALLAEIDGLSEEEVAAILREQS